MLLPLTLIASIYGMNVTLPFFANPQDPVGFWLIIGLMAVVLVLMVAYFRRRGWL
jgi:magnesium transporter